MAEFKLLKYKYTWKGAWQPTTAYKKDDVVAIVGGSYVCLISHTSGSTFSSDLTSGKWIVMTQGSKFRGNWQTTTAYNQFEIVKYKGQLYKSLVAHTSTTSFETDISNWEVYLIAIQWNNTWSTNATYGIGDIVRYGGTVYRCIEGHVSASTFELGLEVDQSKWQIYVEGKDYLAEWTTGIRYKVNDVVIYGGSVWQCKEEHTSGSDSTINFDAEEHWDLLLPGFNFRGDWSNIQTYAAGDVVRHGGYVYTSLTTNYDSAPGIASYEIIENPPEWELLSKSYNYRGQWAPSESYKTGDLVFRGGNLYVAIVDSTHDGSSLDYLDDTNWTLLVTGFKFRGSWTTSAVYAVNEVVQFQGSAYTANVAHISSLENYPGDNGNGFNYWDLLIESASEAGLTSRGDILTYNLSRTATGDGSTFGLTSVPLGNKGEVVTVDSSQSVYYQPWGEISRHFYVSTNGSDNALEAIRGRSPFSPYRTIRYACIEADDGFEGFTTIHVETGLFEEILPIIVPARTVILGSELRSTTIKPQAPITALTIDSTYTIAALTRIALLIPSVIQQLPLPTSKSSGNSLDPITLAEAGSSQAAASIQSLINNINQYINYVLNETGSAVTVTGNNTAVTDLGYTNAVLILEANKDFLAEEAVTFIRNTYPEYVFDSELCKRDIREFINAWKYDIIYTGNYKSVLAARWYSNAVQGSAGDDMFYVRDSTGIRNCTLTGLAGTLNPPDVFDLYRRPTGKSFVSLDPGWGPADDRCWIINRSPYIQNVTTIGTGCVGQKIDGSLHNGGNKSIVSNDFTQVISDGIGAWVLNDGRAELVSVFTYYCQVGYLAEDGGTIRATNGNCSYGTFGAIADGRDLNEIPRTGVVNNRTGEAIVYNVLIGENLDEILAFEYLNAGESYTQAECSIVGAGGGATCVFDDFRDNAVFDIFLQNTSTNPAVQVVGGSGFSVAQGYAQPEYSPGESNTSIAIQSNDEGLAEDYIGKRVIVIEGKGAGQYGYITSFNESTKVATIRKESNDQPGWDNMVPGKPNSAFDGTSLYRIEPRVDISHPGFATSTVNLGFSSNWISSVYGETTEEYFEVLTDFGTGSVIGQDGLIPIIATFDVLKIGRQYALTINQIGAGYAVGDVLTISGDLVGGESPRNDITITVTATSDDSTNSIVSFIYEGTANSGNFVIMTDNGTIGLYSTDGETWQNFTMPTSGSWRALAAGDSRFVTISRGSTTAAYSLNGYEWTLSTMPSNSLWNAVAYGSDVFVAVAENGNAGALSNDSGETWTSITMPTYGDSASNEWVDITYGKGMFVMIAKSNNISAHGVYNEEAQDIVWTLSILDVIDDSTKKDWVSITYGGDKFLAISDTGDIAYSYNADFWYPGTMPPQDDSTPYAWKQVKYAQGVYFAVGDTGARIVGAEPTLGPTTYAATSEDGVTWIDRSLTLSANYKTVVFGNPYVATEDSTVGTRTGIWLAVPNNSSQICKIKTGCKAKARLDISAGVIQRFRIWDPGSGYVLNPDISFIDPTKGNDPSYDARIADGVLAQPSWISRGTGYRSVGTVATIDGDGFADVIPVGKFITISGLPRLPKLGAQLIITDNPNNYTIVTVTELEGSTTTNKIVRLRVTPELKAGDKVEHGTAMEIRTLISNCRITGHDFLDIGTGNFIETNYPDLYLDRFDFAPENEVRQENGGRVFYTSTDQDGNFKAGELFAVEQATGVVTISSDFFSLAGLTELRLGGVRLGGTGAVIREFSTDPTFIENSNNVVPTQRAIARYLQNRLTVGGSEIATASFIAGVISVGPQNIGHTASGTINFPNSVNIANEVTGHFLAQQYFFKTFKLTDDV